MRIQNNISAINTHRQYGINNSAMAKSVEKLSSGYKINRAGDDAAGLAISEKMRAQIRGLNMASKNSQDAVSLIQTAEGALQSTTDILQRMRELAVQAGNDTNEDSDRLKIQAEIDQLVDEIDDVASKTQFNKKILLSGDFKATTATDDVEGLFFQIGANATDQMNITIEAMNATALSVDSLKVSGNLTSDTTDDPAAVDVGSAAANSAVAITAIDSAIELIATQRANLGAIQNRLEFKIANLDNSAENLQAAESRIRDVDMAKEMTNFMKNNILSQASTAMLAQANSLPQGVLQLLG